MSDPNERTDHTETGTEEMDLPIAGPFMRHSISGDDIDSLGNPVAEEFEYVNPDYRAATLAEEAAVSASGLIQELLEEEPAAPNTDEIDGENIVGQSASDDERPGPSSRAPRSGTDKIDPIGTAEPTGSIEMKNLLRTDYDWGMSRQKGRINIHVQSSDEDEDDPNVPLTSANLRRPRRHGPDPRIYDKHGLVGLRNIGNTCFMNSVLQCLSNTKLLLNYIVATKAYVEDINATTSSMRGNLIKAFAKLMQDLWSDTKPNDADTSNLKGQIQKFAPVFRGARQHDSQELLRYLLEGLHNDVNRVTVKPKLPPLDLDDGLDDAKKSELSWNHYRQFDNSQITDIFVGQLKSTLKCLTCGHRSVTFDPFWDLSIPIPSLKTFQQAIKLEECLKLFTQEETLDGGEKPYCSACKTHRKCSKRFTIEKFPDVLVIHLKRFTTDDRGKLRTAVKFPMLGLDMGAFMDTPIPSCMYNLYGISNHFGTAFSGHYIGYCKHPFSNYWHCYDDSRVSKVSEEEVSNAEGYVLFYEMCEASRSIIKTSS